ncbi:hypothetical protein GCM10007862_31360 [Dyella lipolytica]|uniref:DUF2845 domain-containing protein n=1 Tax=Dyella lipolytica TaxID=1867835 RepID=A0ABW8IY51_9GAMM|nr:DUF2845 domain-containing protein [Dyella lipolytica]GLQ48085.1 hypothetical protein GCM10007862_31360 [Dyella lipolytica]
MRRFLILLVLLTCTFSAQALESLRVGSQLLVVGDSAARVKALLGNPSGRAKSATSGKSSSSHKTSSKASSHRKGKQASSAKTDKGEKWQYLRDGHITTVTIVDGKVAHIEDVRR